MQEIIGIDAFKKEIAENDLPVMVFFTAKMMIAPCVLMHERLGPIVNEYADRLKIVSVNVHEPANDSVARECGVRGIPTLVIFKNGQSPFDPLVGASLPEQVRRFIDKNI